MFIVNVGDAAANNAQTFICFENAGNDVSIYNAEGFGNLAGALTCNIPPTASPTVMLRTVTNMAVSTTTAGLYVTSYSVSNVNVGSSVQVYYQVLDSNNVIICSGLATYTEGQTNEISDDACSMLNAAFLSMSTTASFSASTTISNYSIPIITHDCT